MCENFPMVMGYVDKQLGLDSSILTFVEPLGPGQVVDRQSLVNLPQGYLKVSFETQTRRLVLRVHAFREQLATRDRQALRTTVRSFYSIRNHVLEGKPHSQASTENDSELVHVFDKSVMERLAFGEQGSKPGQVREIMQLCIYRGKNRAFLGLVHVAVDILFSQACDGEITHGWYKIFPRSSFTFGCPIACITPHCVNPCPAKHDESVYSSRISKRATCPEKLHTSGEKTQQPSSAAIKLTAYSRVVSVCQALSRRVQMRRPQQQTPAQPVTIDLKVPEALPTSTSSSSIDIGYGSGGSSHDAVGGAPSPRLLGTSLDAVTPSPASKDLSLFRHKSALSISGRASIKRYRRSFNFGDTLRIHQSNSKPTSTIRRSQEVISKHTAEFSSNDDQSTSGSSCSSSQRRIGFCESDFFRRSVGSNASEEASTSFDNFDDDCEVSSRAKAPPMRSISLGGVATRAVARHHTIARTSATALDSTKAPRKQSFRRIARALSRRRKDRGNSTASDGGLKDKKRPPVKASLSFPPNNCVNDEPDNVYEVLLSLKKMSVSDKAPSITQQSEESFSTTPAVAEITVECPPEEQDLSQGVRESTSTADQRIAHNNNNPCRKLCSKRGNFKQRRIARSPNNASSDSERMESKSLSEIQRQRLNSKASLSVQEPLCCPSEDDDDEYVLCSDNFGSIFSSPSSSYVSLEEQAVEC